MPSRAFRAGERATLEQGAGGAAGALRRPADALRMAARRVARAAALLTAALRAANTLKCPRGRFRVREWEKERESVEALGGAVQYLEEIGLV
ncbi:hypothetical protein R1flu_028817 [Riccia fluitans]|uniref:Uncharacterized protein n=1 Tax=Riccia fluitans TaxID=41844 RepID=A0ABD1XNA9_9MARC